MEYTAYSIVVIRYDILIFGINKASKQKSDSESHDRGGRGGGECNAEIEQNKKLTLRPWTTNTHDVLARRIEGSVASNKPP